MSPPIFIPHVQPHGFAPHLAAHQDAFIRHRFLTGPHARFGPGGTLLGLPFSPFVDTAPIQSPAAEPVRPEVIVMPVPTAPHQAPPQASLDFSYVAGCHAIPNGYHCDPTSGHPTP